MPGVLVEYRQEPFDDGFVSDQDGLAVVGELDFGGEEVPIPGDHFDGVHAGNCDGYIALRQLGQAAAEEEDRGDERGTCEDGGRVIGDHEHDHDGDHERAGEGLGSACCAARRVAVEVELFERVRLARLGRSAGLGRSSELGERREPPGNRLVREAVEAVPREPSAGQAGLPVAWASG
jgi:hypothetical protein